jgi:hypothetical protein
MKVLDTEKVILGSTAFGVLTEIKAKNLNSLSRTAQKTCRYAADRHAILIAEGGSNAVAGGSE